MTVEPLIVELDNRSYPIHFSSTFEALKEDLTDLRADCRSMYALSDEGVLAAQPDFLSQAGFDYEEILSVPAGETSKSIEHFGQVLNFLSNKSANRDAALFAFGGGAGPGC